MSRVVTLSTGTEVHLSERFTHGAEKAYNAARYQGVMDRETLIDGKEQFLRETPVLNLGEAVEKSLLTMIEKVKDGEAVRSPDQAWLDSLSEPDYALLAEAMLAIRKETREKAAAGKKNS
jgi:hypothetical protein